MLILATPVVPSSSFIRVSSTKFESFSVSYPSMSTEATAIGSMFGLSFIIYGAPMVSSQPPSTRSTLCRMLTVAVSMLAPASNSMMTME